MAPALARKSGGVQRCFCEQPSCNMCRHRASQRRHRLKYPPTRSADLAEEMRIIAERRLVEDEEEADRGDRSIAWNEQLSPFAKLLGAANHRSYIRTIPRAD